MDLSPPRPFKMRLNGISIICGEEAMFEVGSFELVRDGCYNSITAVEDDR